VKEVIVVYLKTNCEGRERGTFKMNCKRNDRDTFKRTFEGSDRGTFLDEVRPSLSENKQ
jgi:hypothetical protein